MILLNPKKHKPVLPDPKSREIMRKTIDSSKPKVRESSRRMITRGCGTRTSWTS